MASEVWFTSNPADYEDLPGLYINEKDPPGAIKGRRVNVVGFAGKCVRGPLTPQVINSPERFEEIYGGRDYITGGTLVGEVWKALLNKGFGKVVVQRAAAAAAVAGTRVLPNAVPTTIATATASSVGAWSLSANGGPTVSVEAATDGDATKWNARVKYKGKEWLHENLNTQSGYDNLAEVQGSDTYALPILLTKNADGRPVNAADLALSTVAGADGTIAASDYSTAITAIANYQGVNVCLVPENAVTQTTLNSTIVTLAAAANDRIFLTWSGTHGQSVATEVTAVGTHITTRSDRIVWCFNSAKTIDPVTGLKIDTAPHVWLASVLAQTDVDIHPGSHETAKFLAGIAELRNESLSRQDLIDMQAAGITALEKLPDEFLFRSAVTTSLVSGRTEITRRRMADYLQLSASDRLKYYVKTKNTLERRTQMIGELVDFTTGLQKAGRVVDNDDADLGPAIKVASVSTSAERGRGLEKVSWQVRLVSHMLAVVLETSIGTGLTIAKN